MGSGVGSVKGAGVMAVSLDASVLGGDVTGGLVGLSFVFVGAGSFTLVGPVGRAGTAGVSATGAMVRVVKAVLVVLGVAGCRFRDRLVEFKSAK